MQTNQHKYTIINVYAHVHIMENRKYTCGIKHKLFVVFSSEEEGRHQNYNYDLKKIIVMLECTPT